MKQFAQATAAALIAMTACTVALAVFGGTAVAHDDDENPNELRQFIYSQVGGIRKFAVPATDAAIPLPRNADGSVNPSHAARPPKRPPRVMPMAMPTWLLAGPGRNWQSATR